MKEINKDELLDRYNAGTASDEEKSLVESWYLKSPIYDAVPDMDQVLKDQERSKELLVEYMQKGQSRLLWGRLAVAASIVVVFGMGIWFYMLQKTESRHELSQTMKAAENIEPGKNKATLTLANGKTIDLNGAKSGIVIDAGKLSYNDGTVLQEEGAKKAASAGQQLLMASTPRGGTYQIILPDGSKVWLNAASTLKFPITFSGLAQRVVKLSGEAYFEISKDKKHPFIVESSGQKVEVLGTHFNIDSYGDEEEAKTTLIEGSVKVSLDNHHQPKQGQVVSTTSRLLKPGEQSKIGKSATTIGVSFVNIDEVIAWKDGDFIFNDESFELIMKKMARWYNIDVIYERKPEGQSFTGVISRDKKLSEVLNALIKTKKVNFRVEGRKVTVF